MLLDFELKTRVSYQPVTTVRCSKIPLFPLEVVVKMAILGQKKGGEESDWSYPALSWLLLVDLVRLQTTTWTIYRNR